MGIPALPFCHLRLMAAKPRSKAYPSVLRTYGDHLRAKRLNLGLIQRQVAEEIGVDKCSIYNWENNRVEPTVRCLPRILEFLSYCPYTPGLPLSGKLKMWRQSMGYSQEKMAKVLGVDEGTLRRWEARRRSPSAKYRVRIKFFLDVAYDD